MWRIDEIGDGAPFRSRGSGYLVVCNPWAGLGSTAQQRALLSRSLTSLEGPVDFVEIAAAGGLKIALDHRDPHGERIVVAAGGDGTVRSVACAAVATGRPLGVLPIGTRNHFARDAGVPLDLGAAIETLGSGVEIRVDTGEVAGHLFLNNASLGLYPRFVDERRLRQRRTSRWRAIAGAAWWVLRQRRRLHLRLDDEPGERRASVLFVGNNAYTLEGLRLGRRDRLDAGVLTLLLASPTGPWSAARLIARAAAGRLDRERRFEHRLADRVCIDTRRRAVRVALDGEPFLRLATPLEFRIRRRALRLLVPRTGSRG